MARLISMCVCVMGKRFQMQSDQGALRGFHRVIQSLLIRSQRAQGVYTSSH